MKKNKKYHDSRKIRNNRKSVEFSNINMEARLKGLKKLQKFKVSKLQEKLNPYKNTDPVMNNEQTSDTHSIHDIKKPNQIFRPKSMDKVPRIKLKKQSDAVDPMIDANSRNDKIMQFYKRDRKQHLSVELNKNLMKKREERLRKSHNSNITSDIALTPSITKRQFPDSNTIDKLEENKKVFYRRK